jgi:membrane-associated protein
VIGSGYGLYRYLQDVHKPVDETASHPEDRPKDLRDAA